MLSNKKEKELSQIIAKEFEHLPEGEKLKECIQCGTCSGSCPVSFAMDYTPRQIIAMLRADMINEVLKSNTVWICASCYLCGARCPAGINFTDFMYHLKQEGIKYGIGPRNKKAIKMAKDFGTVVSEHGRNFESELLVRYNLRTNPFNFFKLIPLAIKMLLTKRMPFFPSRVKGIKFIRKVLKSKTTPKPAEKAEVVS